MDDKNVDVKLSLLINFRNILNITASRGAFKPDEFKVVGTFYQEINDIIKPHIPQPPETPEDSSVEPAPEDVKNI